MRKKFALIPAVILALSALAIGIGAASHTKNAKTDDPVSAYALVNEKIDELTSSEKYIRSALAERRDMAADLLSSLSEQGYISNISYDELGNVFSFEYPDGSLGGLKTDDFASSPGALPMN